MASVPQPAETKQAVKVDRPQPTRTPTGGTVPMTGGGKRAVAWAMQNLGVRESGGNRGVQIDKWQREFGMAGQPYCGAFIGAAMRRAGAKGITNRIVYVPNIIADAKSKRNGFAGWYTNARQARVGDAVVLLNGGHVGMVVGVNRDGSVTTVEGNTSTRGGGEGVARKRRSGSEITGFARVRY